MTSYDEIYTSSDSSVEFEKPSYVQDTVEKVEEVSNQILLGKVANCQAAYVRTSPSKRSKEQIVVHKGDTVMVSDCDDPEWYTVETSNGITGYIMKSLVSVD